MSPFSHKEAPAPSAATLSPFSLSLWPLLSVCVHLLGPHDMPFLFRFWASFLSELSSNLLYEETMFCFPVHQLIGSWVVSTFWLLRIILL